MNKICVLFLAFIAISFYQCGSSQKFLSDGNYTKSYKTALKKLERGKGTKSDEEALLVSFEKIYEAEMEKILELQNGTTLEEGLTAYQQYESLYQQYQEGEKYLGLKSDPRIMDLIEGQDKLANELHADYRVHGEDQLEKSKMENSKSAARNAYNYFEKSLAFKHSEDVSNLLSEAEKLAVTVYVVETRAPFNPSYEPDIEAQFERLENRDDKFLRIYFDRYHKDADCIFQIEFDRVEFDESRNQFSEDFSRDVTVQQTSTNAAGEIVTTNVTERVFAERVTTQFISRIWTEAYVRVDGNRECETRERTLADGIENVFEEYQIYGDSRAITGVNRRANGSRRYERDMVDELMRRIYSQFVRNYL